MGKTMIVASGWGETPPLSQHLEHIEHLEHLEHLAHLQCLEYVYTLRPNPGTSRH